MAGALRAPEKTPTRFALGDSALLGAHRAASVIKAALGEEFVTIPAGFWDHPPVAYRLFSDWLA